MEFLNIMEDGKNVHFTMLFDKSFLVDFAKDQTIDGGFMSLYRPRNINVTLEFYKGIVSRCVATKIEKIRLFFTFTADDVYVESVVIFDSNTYLGEENEWITDEPIEFDVKLSEPEKKKLLLWVIAQK
jgi:hypothetical protein